MKMGRWEESARLLMLAGDVPALSRDFPGAREILKQAHPQELSAGDGAIVLGDAALRVAAPDIALALTHDADRSEAIRRIRASARIDYLNLPDEESLNELKEIALAGGPESNQAAFARLVACLPPIKAPWDEDVAQVIDDEVGAQRFLPSLRITHLAATGRVTEAQELADRLPDTMWAAELQLRVAGFRGAHSVMRTAAEKFLGFGPDASGRLLAAVALAKAGELEQAGQLLATIAHETNASPLVRSNAFAMLLQTLSDRDMWEQATIEWTAWQTFGHRHLPHTDSRISVWQVRVAKHAPKAE